MRAFLRKSSDDTPVGINISEKDKEAAKIITGENVKKITMSTTPPTSPKVGDIWIDIS